MSQKNIFVVHHGNAWAVKRPDAERSSAVTRTQAEAIERARALEPNAVVHVQSRHGEFRPLTPFDPD